MELKRTNIEHERQVLLDGFRKKQPFRCSIGKSSWFQYEKFNPAINLREIQKDEIVIEFDSDDLERVMRGISGVGLALYNAGYYFEWWDHMGRSPHLHIKNLPIPKDVINDKDKLRLFKKAFILTYVPGEFHDIVDTSLCGIKLIALEWQRHWKGKAGIKKLVSVFDGPNKKSWGVCDE